MSDRKVDTNPAIFQGPKYWKSLDEVAETPAFREWAEREFPVAASELEGFNRRNFLRIMAASFGLAGLGLSGCRRPEAVILPYGRQPENLIPGVAQYYASSRPAGRENIPVIVETHGARPTKIEGNPSFAPSGGKTDIYTQASILDLYDPARKRRHRSGRDRLNRALTRDELRSTGRSLREQNGAGVSFVVDTSSSPARLELARGLLAAMPEAQWCEFSPTDYPYETRCLSTLFAKDLKVLPRFEKAKRILSLDSDFLGKTEGSVFHTKAFSRGRKILSAQEALSMNRLYVVEGDFTNTGTMADHRLRLESGYHPAFAAALAAAVLRLTQGDSSLADELEALAAGLPIDTKWIEEAAADLIAHRGESLVVVGPGQPEAVHALAVLINQQLGAFGKTVDLLEVEKPVANSSLQDVAQALRSGKVDTLILVGSNPVFTAPYDLQWPIEQKKARRVIHFGLTEDESAVGAHLSIAASHYLESWSDGRALDGTYLPVQPMIEPLTDSISELEFLALLAGMDAPDPYELVRASFQKQANGADFSIFLAEGLLPGSGYQATSPRKVSPASLRELLSQNSITLPRYDENALEVVFKPGFATWDGSFANNGWMMECPDPMTRLSWDNAILVSPVLARAIEERGEGYILPGTGIMQDLGGILKKYRLVRQKGNFIRGREVAPVVRLTVDGREIEGPLHVQPGLADHTVVVTLGYGRDVVGPVGQGAGYNAYPLRSTNSPYCCTGVSLSLTEREERLANVQEHWSVEGRAIIREATVTDYATHPDFVKKMGMESHSPPIFGTAKDAPLEVRSTEIPRGGSLYKTPGSKDPIPMFDAPQQWGMSIDLNQCTGCNACVVACQSENNIPIVGKDQVLRGREMHWIRIDRYFSASEEEDPTKQIPSEVQVTFQGVACQHCELAPCETVCPVNATVHDSQGLNVMAYNRCVGTRYCANNCPYKVRRFNFFDWNKREIGQFYRGPLGEAGMEETLKMQKNPDVTIRMRGVMEKCTYCVQRIEKAKIDQKVKAAKAGRMSDIEVPDRTIQVACQQACPADAIAFGDITDTQSEVYKMKNLDRDYTVLGYLNIRPRTSYLAKIRNPNAKMPKAYKMPFSRAEYEARFGHGAHH
ncbi:MAG: TAT-variant-translocated molybdopterin oxidoreductase [Puniceicoccaceae bacterium]